MLSIFLVTTIAYILIFTMVPRQNIFIGDTAWTKLSGKPDERVNYEYTTYKKMGYVDYKTTHELCNVATEGTDNYQDCISNPETYATEWAKSSKGWEIGQYPLSKDFYAVREIPIFERVARFYGNLIKIDHPWAIDDPNLDRNIYISNNETSGLSLACSGCRSKHLVYFDGTFPFIHQNIITLDMGTSYPTFSGRPVMDVITDKQGTPVQKEVTFETGLTTNSSIDVHSCTYKPTEMIDHLDEQRFVDNYANCKQTNGDPSMIGISMMTGIVAVALSYLIAIPFGITIARNKGKMFDRFGTGIVMVLMSVPSIAFIYFFRFLGSTFLGLPDTFPALGAGNFLSYVLPTLVLALLNVPGLTVWIRRYMVDQQSADYVKFAKAKGLSEKEISKRHIFRNAIIPITQGIARSFILSITGATITESIFVMPGMGKMLPDAINSYNNTVVIGLVFVFTTLSVLSVLLGDITLTMVDPRIKLSDSKGGR